jgi:hypothetical protein
MHVKAWLALFSLLTELHVFSTAAALDIQHQKPQLLQYSADLACSLLL